MRSFSLVLLRRLLFRPAPSTNSNSTSTLSANIPRLTLYDHLSHQTLATLERLLLFSLSHEASSHVRRKTVDTVCDLSNQGMVRGRPWHALQAQAFSMIQTQGPSSPIQDGGAALRESAFRVFSGCPNLVMDLQTDAVLNVLGRGLQDRYSIEVKVVTSHRLPF
jgi:importin-5